METKTDIRKKAMDLLARREHSRRELARKLHSRDYASQEIEATLDKLEQDNLLSDDRFCEAYITMRGKRGYGPTRIRMELQERGVEDTLITTYLNEADAQWKEQARHVREKKFGSDSPTDMETRAKQMRFLQYRGFTSEHIRAAIE